MDMEIQSQTKDSNRSFKRLSILNKENKGKNKIKNLSMIPMKLKMVHGLSIQFDLWEKVLLEKCTLYRAKGLRNSMQ
jgi:hypothetical protein